jgi:hypothetical protein
MISGNVLISYYLHDYLQVSQMDTFRVGISVILNAGNLFIRRKHDRYG